MIKMPEMFWVLITHPKRVKATEAAESIHSLSWSYHRFHRYTSLHGFVIQHGMQEHVSVSPTLSLSLSLSKCSLCSFPSLLSLSLSFLSHTPCDWELLVSETVWKTDCFMAVGHLGGWLYSLSLSHFSLLLFTCSRSLFLYPSLFSVFSLPPYLCHSALYSPPSLSHMKTRRLKIFIKTSARFGVKSSTDL